MWQTQIFTSPQMTSIPNNLGSGKGEGHIYSIISDSVSKRCGWTNKEKEEIKIKKFTMHNDQDIKF